jgi:hypothetical protein
LRIYFARDFGGYVDNLLAPEKRATSPSNKNSLSFGVDIGFKFSKLPWTINECVRTHLTCAVGVVGEINGCLCLEFEKVANCHCYFFVLAKSWVVYGKKSLFFTDNRLYGYSPFTQFALFISLITIAPS